jgi:hypothetical protein
VRIADVLPITPLQRRETIMTAYRRAISRNQLPRFQPTPLLKIFLSLVGRRTKKVPPMPLNVDWERDEPMNGLS